MPERATITNMAAELGATTSIFPSDEITRTFLKAQGREEVYQPLASDADAVYDEEYIVDLDALVPLAAMPHMPDNVKPVCEIGPIEVNQCCIGSCTNSSYYDMMKVAAGLHAGISHAGKKWCTGGYYCSRCAYLGVCMRSLHRYGTVSRIGRRFAAYV